MISLGLKSLYMLQGGQQYEVIFIATDLKKRTKMKAIGDVMETFITVLRQSLQSNSRLVSSNSLALSEKESTMSVHDKQFNLFIYVVVTAPVYIEFHFWADEEGREGGSCYVNLDTKINFWKRLTVHIFLHFFFLLQDQSYE